MKNYSDKERKDIKERSDKVFEFVTSQQFEIQAQVIAMDTGDNIFGLKVIPYLKDTKFLDEVSETKVVDVEAKEAPPTVEPTNPQPLA